MITIEKRDNYVFLQVTQPTSWSTDLLENISEAIKAHQPSVIVDAVAVDASGMDEGLAKEIAELDTLGNVVLIVGDHYDTYDAFEDVKWHVTPTLNEATDMLFMIEMENELGGEDFEI